jgi:hypothetical protein
MILFLHALFIEDNLDAPNFGLKGRLQTNCVHGL